MPGCQQAEPVSIVRQEFKPNERSEPYAQGIPLTEMDFSVYSDIVTIAEGNVSPYPRCVTLPCDVEYFAFPNASAPAVTLQAGTEVYVVGQNYHGQTIGYGLMCWPDYQEGWRYAIPLRTKDFFSLKSLPDEERIMYYVKTEQILPICYAYAKVMEEYSGAIPNDAAKLLAFQIDRGLYINGAFCSIDLEKHYDNVGRI